RQTTAELKTVARMNRLPGVLATILGFLAAATLAHALVTTIGRRRRDLAVLSSLGLGRRKLRATVLWQAATMTAVALVVGLPIGVVVGRWAWRLFADQIAVLPLPRLSPNAVV